MTDNCIYTIDFAFRATNVILANVVFFDLWHHWGRTAKFGGWMQGPDYTQWHGAYEVLRELAELRDLVSEKLEEAGIEP